MPIILQEWVSPSLSKKCVCGYSLKWTAWSSEGVCNSRPQMYRSASRILTKPSHLILIILIFTTTEDRWVYFSLLQDSICVSGSQECSITKTWLTGRWRECRLLNKLRVAIFVIQASINVNVLWLLVKSHYKPQQSKVSCLRKKHSNEETNLALNCWPWDLPTVRLKVGRANHFITELPNFSS